MFDRRICARSSRLFFFGRRLVPWIALGLLLGMGCSSPPPAPEGPTTEVVYVPVLEVIDAYSDLHPVDFENPAWKLRVPRPPIVKFDPSRHYYWYLHTTEGVLKIELKPQWAPRRVAAILYLTQLGFYDGLVFHRIIPKFMVQGGDPLGTGGGGPGFLYPSEFHRKARHSKRGIVAMANSGPRTEGSQFYILLDKADHLDGRHTVFGQVVGGLGTLRLLESYGSESGKPRKPVAVNRAEVREE